MEVNIEDKVVSSEPPPAYCTLARNGSCLDTSRNSVAVSDVDEEPLVGATFLNKNVRIGFIQKVLVIRFLQALAASVIINAAVVYWYRESFFCDYRTQLMILSCMLHLATRAPLICYRREATMMPFNIVFLVAYPLTSTFVLVVITSGYLEAKLEFCFAWNSYTTMLLGQLIFSVFCLDSSMEYRVGTAMFHGAALTLVSFSLSGVCLVSSYFELHYWAFKWPWLCVFTLLLFGECAFMQCQLSVMTKKNHSRLIPADFMTGTLYTYIVFGYNYSNYLKSFKSKVCSYFE